MAKFKVDDWALIKGTNGKIKVHIIQVHTQECYAGAQVDYTCRPMPRDWSKQWSILPERTITFNEIELEPIPIEESGGGDMVQK